MRPIRNIDDPPMTSQERRLWTVVMWVLFTPAILVATFLLIVLLEAVF